MSHVSLLSACPHLLAVGSDLDPAAVIRSEQRITLQRIERILIWQAVLIPSCHADHNQLRVQVLNPLRRRQRSIAALR